MKKSTISPEGLQLAKPPDRKPHSSIEIQLTGPGGEPFDIPTGGSIGLLALGDLGTIAWRQKVQQVKSELARRTQAHLAEGPNPIPSTHKNSGHEKE